MQDAITAGVRLCKRARLAMALVTLDRDGMVWVQTDGQGEAFPTCSRQIYDITGAGDMVLAMLGLCFGGGVDFRSSVRLANVAAGLEVERPGVAILRRMKSSARWRPTMPGAGTRSSDWSKPGDWRKNIAGKD